MEIKGVASKGIVGNITVLLRTYYSSHHLWATEHFAKLVGEIEGTLTGTTKFDIQHRAYATNCVLSSVAFLEAAINELYKDRYDTHLGYIDPLADKVRATIADFWEMTEQGNKSYVSILDKYQLALRFADAEPFTKGGSPYQDVDVLIKIRNELMHYNYKPESLGGDNVHKLEARLRGKFAENRLMSGSGNPFFPDKALGKGCADWATVSIRTFADEFFARIGITPNYQRADFSEWCITTASPPFTLHVQPRSRRQSGATSEPLWPSDRTGEGARGTERGRERATGGPLAREGKGAHIKKTVTGLGYDFVLAVLPGARGAAEPVAGAVTAPRLAPHSSNACGILRSSGVPLSSRPRYVTKKINAWCRRLNTCRCPRSPQPEACMRRKASGRARDGAAAVDPRGHLTDNPYNWSGQGALENEISTLVPRHERHAVSVVTRPGTACPMAR